MKCLNVWAWLTLALESGGASAFIPSAALNNAVTVCRCNRGHGLRATADAVALDTPLAPGSVAPVSARTRTAEEIIAAARETLRPAFEQVDLRTQRVLKRVLTSFRKHQVGNHLFGGVDGYGHGDMGRETLESIWADLFGAEAALVRVQMFSGTHAISCALFGVLRPGDVMLGISGRPYDTLEEVIGVRKPCEENDRNLHGMRELTGSFKEWGIGYEQVDLLDGGEFDVDAINASIEANPAIRVIHIQRSCGYQWRPSLPVQRIGDVIASIRKRWPDRELVIFVDNCYGEFVEDIEPTHVGADIVAGSLIKRTSLFSQDFFVSRTWQNPGGTLVPTGGYVIGKQHYVSAAFKRLSAPGVEGGATLGQNRWMLQGLFMAPSIVGESLKGATLLAEVFGRQLGMPCQPPAGTARTDIIQAIQVGSRDGVVQFCKQVQKHSPVNAYIEPTPGATPGYGDEVVFAVGTFVDGSTLELSADGPLREPYTVFVQGCTHWTHWAIVLEEALVEMGLAKASVAQGGR